MSRRAGGRSFNLEELKADTVDASTFLRDGSPLSGDFLEGVETFVVDSKSDLTGLTEARTDDVAFVEYTDSSTDPEIYVLQTDDPTVEGNWSLFDISADVEGAVNTVSIINDKSQLDGISEPVEGDVALVDSSEDAGGSSLTYVYTGLNWVPLNSQVESVFGRYGDVSAEQGDYDFSQIAGSVSDGQVPESGVTQHEDALQISEEQIGDLYSASTRFYVDGSTGDDSNDGRSERNSFKTIGRAVQQIVTEREQEEGASGRYVVQGNPQTMYTIHVAAGDYEVDNPIMLPDNVAIMGDELRNTRVFPKNPKRDIFHVNSLNFIWGLRFLDHKSPSFAFAFPCANAEATISNGSISDVELLYSPDGYSQDPPALIDAPRDPNGTKAELDVTVNNGTITDITVVDGGSGYDGTLEAPRVSIPAPEDQQPWVTGSPYPLNCSSITGPFDINGNEIPPTLPLPYDTSEPGYDPVTDTTYSDPVDMQGAGGGIMIDGHVCYGWNSMTEPETDTDLPRSPLRSFVSAQFTQVNQGGPGFEIINEGFSQFVSCFTTFCSHGYKAKGGGKGLISNSVSDFGNEGLVSEGYFDDPYNSGDIVNDEFSTVASITVTEGGSGYTSPELFIYGGGASTDAQASATLDGDSIAGVTVDDSGAGYTSKPSIDVIRSDADTSLTLNAVDDSNWEITSINGYKADADTSVNNPELTLDTNVRYTINNDSNSNHPLALRDSNGNDILTQESGVTGSYEGDSEVNWVDNGTDVQFTLTPELADELDRYVCTVHSSKQGSIVIGDLSKPGETEAVLDIALNKVGEITVNNLDTFFQPGAEQQVRNPEQGTIFFLDGLAREITTWSEGDVDGEYNLSFFPSVESVSQGTSLTMHKRSTINSGGHVFEYPGTGVTYNALPEYGGITDLAQQTVEFGAGRTFHTSSDNQGNFYVGESFQVDQQTGQVTIDTDQFDLSGLNAIGPFRVDGVLRGVQLNEVSNRNDLQSNSGLAGNTVPTISAIRNFFIGGNRTIPEGGLDGQVLSKISDSDRDIDWEYVSYNDLVDVPSEFTPASHGNEAHDVSFAEDPHGNEAHSGTFIENVGIQDFGIDEGTADTLNFREEIAVSDVSNGVATINADVNIEGSNTLNPGQNSIVLEAGEGITLARFQIPTGRTLRIFGGYVSDKDGNAVAGETEMELFNHTTGTTEFVIDSSDYSYNPDGVYTGSAGDEVEFRLVNATGQQKVLSGNMMVELADSSDI